MKIAISTPQAINNIGGRGNNEDSIYPPSENATTNNQLFLVCDGVGGNDKGEIASRLACDKFAEYFEQHTIEVSDQAYIDEVLKYTESAFDKYFEDHSEAKGMATTLTLLYLHKNGATVAHVGDSRVYQFREGEIIFQTIDHSLVNDLLKAGAIDEEQAKDHPQKNVISRAIQGSCVKSTKAEVDSIIDIKAGDYFFMCSDGILENISDFEIGQVLNQSISDAEKKEQILKRCLINPHDNFTCYIVPIKSVDGFVDDDQKEVSVDAVEIDAQDDEELIIEAEEIQESVFNRLKKLFPLKKKDKDK